MKPNPYPTTSNQPEKAKRKHEEASLHLKFCKHVKKHYPNDHFIRHERERARGKAVGNMMKVYNTEIDMPDFELLEPSGHVKYCTWDENGEVDAWHYEYMGFLIEFKRPGRNITLTDGITIASDLIMQYKAHIALWERGRCAYFANDLDEAIELLEAYKSGNPLPMQKFVIPLSKQEQLANAFFDSQGL